MPCLQKFSFANKQLLTDNSQCDVGGMWRPSPKRPYDRSARRPSRAKTIQIRPFGRSPSDFGDLAPTGRLCSLPHCVASRRSSSRAAEPFMPMGLREQVFVSNVYNGLEQPTSQHARMRTDLSALPRSARLRLGEPVHPRLGRRIVDLPERALLVLCSPTPSHAGPSTKPGDAPAASSGVN